MEIEIVANEIHYKNHEINFNISIEKNRIIDIDWVITKNGNEIKNDCSSLAQAIFYIDKFIIDK